MNVVVTGASSGVGYELVKNFIQDQKVAKILGVARRDGPLEELRAFAVQQGRGDVFVPIVKDVCTVSKEDFAKHLGRVDILVNNAGLLINKPFKDLSTEDFRAVYEVNVFAPARIINMLSPLMGGDIPTHVINIGSMGGFQGSVKFPGLSAYSSSKSAIAGLTECLAEEFKEDNIKVNCLAFGAVQTEMLSKAFPDFKAPVNSKQMADHVCQFAQTGHKYYNGKVLPVSSTTP